MNVSQVRICISQDKPDNAAATKSTKRFSDLKKLWFISHSSTCPLRADQELCSVSPPLQNPHGQSSHHVEHWSSRGNSRGKGELWWVSYQHEMLWFRSFTHHFHSNSLNRTRQIVLPNYKEINNVILPTMFPENKREPKNLVYSPNDQQRSPLVGRASLARFEYQPFSVLPTFRKQHAPIGKRGTQWPILNCWAGGQGSKREGHTPTSP